MRAYVRARIHVAVVCESMYMNFLLPSRKSDLHTFDEQAWWNISNRVLERVHACGEALKYNQTMGIKKRVKCIRFSNLRRKMIFIMKRS